MEKELRIVRVQPITRGANPVIVLHVEGQNQPIVRQPKQLIEDLIQSGRLPADVKKYDELVDLEARNLRGKVAYGNVRVFKAGEEYIVNEFSSAVTDPNHELYGKVKVGQKAKHQTDGVWVEGFLDIPLTRTEIKERLAELRETRAKVATNDDWFDDEDVPTPVSATAKEAFGG